jgi:hypothetical protein
LRVIIRKFFSLCRSSAVVACLAALLMAAAGCGGGGGHTSIPPPPADPVTVSVPTNAATVRTNGTQAFTATALHAGNLGIAWSVQEGAAGGTISSSGVYTAPATSGTYHIVATSQQDTSKNAVITVVVLPPISLTLAPASAVVRLGASQTFTATVQYANNATATWSVQEGAAGGTVTPNGVYTAPNTAGTYHVIAASKEDPTKTAVAIVTVPVNVAVSPTAPTLSVRQTLTFVASVAGSSNKGVTWSVQEAGGGTITSAGVYTAPSLAGTYHVIAASAADPTQSASAAVTVQSSSATGTIQ